MAASLRALALKSVTGNTDIYVFLLLIAFSYAP